MYLSIYSISMQLDFSPKLCSPTHMYDIHKWNHVISEGHVASGVCAAAQRIISDVQVRHHLCAASAAGQSGASSCIIPSSLFFCVACVSSLSCSPECLAVFSLVRHEELPSLCLLCNASRVSVQQRNSHSRQSNTQIFWLYETPSTTEPSGYYTQTEAAGIQWFSVRHKQILTTPSVSTTFVFLDRNEHFY